MKRFTSILPPTKIDLDHHQALEKLADKLQTSASQLTRQAIAEFLAKHGFL
jgi:predicted transcriptional regulator